VWPGRRQRQHHVVAPVAWRAHAHSDTHARRVSRSARRVMHAEGACRSLQRGAPVSDTQPHAAPPPTHTHTPLTLPSLRATRTAAACRAAAARRRQSAARGRHSRRPSRRRRRRRRLAFCSRAPRAAWLPPRHPGRGAGLWECVCVYVCVCVCVYVCVCARARVCVCVRGGRGVDVQPLRRAQAPLLSGPCAGLVRIRQPPPHPAAWCACSGSAARRCKSPACTCCTP
jgi:hypothetical protein